MPYSGEIKIDPKPVYPAEHLVIVIPKTMQFKTASPHFQSVQNPQQGDTIVEMAQQTKPGAPLSFTLKGNGIITEGPGETASGAAQQQDQQQDQQQTQGRDTRPGGGLGVPIDAPDALQKYRGYILGAFAVLLAFGGWLVTKRQPVAAGNASSAAKLAAASTGNAALSSPAAVAPNGSATGAGAPAAKSSMLLEALKEELFQLEVERKQGKITPADYEKAKDALDQTLERALKRRN